MLLKYYILCFMFIYFFKCKLSFGVPPNTHSHLRFPPYAFGYYAWLGWFKGRWLTDVYPIRCQYQVAYQLQRRALPTRKKCHDSKSQRRFFITVNLNAGKRTLLYHPYVFFCTTSEKAKVCQSDKWFWYWCLGCIVK